MRSLECKGNKTDAVRMTAYYLQLTIVTAIRSPTKINMRALLVLTILFMALVDSAVGAKPAGLTASQFDELKASEEKRELQLYQALDNKLSAHKESLENLVDRHLGLFETTVNRMVWGYTALFTAFLAFIYWFVGSKRKELEKMLKKWMREDAQLLIDEAGTELRLRVDSLSTELAALTDYKNRKIVWVCPPSTWQHAQNMYRNSKAVANQEIFEALNAFGLHNIQMLTPGKSDTKIDLGGPDLVILSFDNTDEGRRLLQEIVQQLKSQSPPVFLIIETYVPNDDPHRLSNVEFGLLEGFLWYVPVNFPAQLVAQVQLLVRRDTSRLGGAAHG